MTHGGLFGLLQARTGGPLRPYAQGSHAMHENMSISSDAPRRGAAVQRAPLAKVVAAAAPPRRGAAVQRAPLAKVVAAAAPRNWTLTGLPKDLQDFPDP